MNKLTSFFLFSCCLVTTVTFAQKNRLGGVKMEDEKYITQPLKSAQRSSLQGSARTLRDSFEIEPMDQGHISGCVCYTIAHALSIRRKLYFDYKCTEKKPPEKFSASYIFNQLCTNNNCDSGIYMTDALDILLSQGICPTNTFPNDPYGCDSLPLPKHKIVADRYKVRKYKRVFKLEQECLDEPGYSSSFKKYLENTAIAEIEQGNPVLVVMQVTQDFSDCTDGRNWMLPKDIKPELGHAMVLVGYDDIRQEFELLNSFGPEWCDEGFVHISYEDFAKTVRYGYVLFLDGARLDCKLR